MISLHEHLHKIDIDSLLEASIYFREKGWTGTLTRISSAKGIHNIMAETFGEVAKVFAEIDSESMLELRTEVREAHTKLLKTKRGSGNNE